jgi:Schlafen, AlbA_2
MGYTAPMYKSIEEIEALIGTAEESIDLEFKSGRVFDDFNPARQELVKDVTAFANAGGGTIIFGVAERQEYGRIYAGRIESITNRTVTKDRIAETIWANTDPSFRGFKINVIPVPGGGDIYVIHVDQGDTAYQNRIDKRFYQRVEAISQPMYAFAIRDVMNRRTHPVIAADLKIQDIRIDAALHEYRVTPRLINDGSVTAHHWMLYVDLPFTVAHYIPGAARLPTIVNLGEIYLEQWKMYRYEFSSERTPDLLSPRILPSETKVLDPSTGYGTLLLTITEANGHKILEIGPPLHWVLFVDDAERREGSVPYNSWCRW